MKAPDKIYLSVEKGEDWAYAMWTQKNPEEQKFSDLDEHEEYIRKDALIEWAKGEQSKCSDETHPYHQFMNVVLEKINSL